MKRKIFLWLSFVVLTSPVVLLLADEQPAPRQLLLTQATDGWRSLQTYCTQGEFNFRQKRTTSSSDGPDKGVSVTHRERHVLIKGDQFQFTQDIKEKAHGASTTRLKNMPEIPPGLTKKCVSFNLRNVFATTYRSRTAKWVIEHLDDPANARTQDIRRMQCSDWFEFLTAPWSTGNVSFADLIRKPGFQLGHMSSLGGPGETWLRLTSPTLRVLKKLKSGTCFSQSGHCEVVV